MNYHNSAKSVIVVSTLVLLFASLSQGHAGVQPGVTGLLSIVQIQFSGLLVCSPTGNPPPSGGIPGAAGVILSGSCNGASGSLGQAVTNTDGFYNGILTLLDAILFDPSQGMPCFLTLKLPVIGISCQAFPTTGTLRAPLQLVRVVTNQAGGLVAIVTAGPFQHLA